MKKMSVKSINSYHKVLDNLLEGCQIIGYDWKYLYANNAVANHGQRVREDFVGHTVMGIYPGIESTEMFAELQDCMKNRTPHSMENEFTYPDGFKGWFEHRIEPVLDGIMILSFDITERKQAEEKALRINETLQVIRGINQLILQTEDEPQLLQQACVRLIHGRNYKLAWIGLIQKDSFDVLPVAQSGFEEGYLSSVKIKWDESEYGRGPTGSAIKTKRPAIMRDVSNDPQYHPWREQALKRGYRSSIALPLMVEDEVIGALNIYSSFSDAFDEMEVSLLVEMAGDISLGITKIRQRKARKQVEEKLGRLYSWQSTMRRINQILFTAKDETELFQEICNMLVGIGDICFAWVGPLIENSFEVKAVAYAGHEEGYLSCIRVTWDDSQYGQGPTGLAVKTGKPSVIRDVENDPRFGLWREEALKRGYASEIALPFVNNNTIIGTLNVYSKKKDAFLNEEVDFLQEVSADIAIGIRTSRLQRQLEKSLEDARRTLESTVEAFSLLCETRDPYTAGHEHRVAELALAIAKEMGLPQQQIDGIRIAGHIHDIGKVAVPTDILNKPGPLSEHEFGIVKTHPQVAYNILKKLDFPWPVAQMVLQHHERLDGSGYPQGLSGEDIILEAKILGVADVVEATSSLRPYRATLGIDRALLDILQKKGVLYDPVVIDACLKLFTEKGFKLEYENF